MNYLKLTFFRLTSLEMGNKPFDLPIKIDPFHAMNRYYKKKPSHGQSLAVPELDFPGELLFSNTGRILQADILMKV